MEYKEDIGGDVRGPAAVMLADWTLKYPEEFRKLLSMYGEDDRHDKALEAFNREIIELANYCHGKSRPVFSELLDELYESWSGVLSRRKRQSVIRAAEIAEEQVSRMSESEILNLLDSGELPGERNFVISDEAQALRRALGDESRARYLALRTGAAFVNATLRRLRFHGHGPVLHRAAATLDKEALDRWLGHTFGLGDAPAERFPERQPGGWKPGARPWLYMAAEGPDADYLCNHLIAWGGSVVGPVELALEAAQIASHASLAGAVLEVDPNIEASLVICHVLFRRRVPFVAIAREVTPPPGMGLGGKVLRGSVSIDEIRLALASLPESAIVGMNISPQPNIVWG